MAQGQTVVAHKEETGEQNPSNPLKYTGNVPQNGSSDTVIVLNSLTQQAIYSIQIMFPTPKHILFIALDSHSDKYKMNNHSI